MLMKGIQAFCLPAQFEVSLSANVHAFSCVLVCVIYLYPGLLAI